MRGIGELEGRVGSFGRELEARSGEGSNVNKLKVTKNEYKDISKKINITKDIQVDRGENEKKNINEKESIKILNKIKK